MVMRRRGDSPEVMMHDDSDDSDTPVIDTRDPRRRVDPLKEMARQQRINSLESKGRTMVLMLFVVLVVILFIIIISMQMFRNDIPAEPKD